ncbi:MAG: porin, partial [Desulfocapsaceae bacterium]
GVLCVLIIFYSAQVIAGGSSKLDSDMLHELKRMIEQQQAQIDQQAAEIAALKEQLAGNTEAIAVKADKEDTEDLEKVAYSSFSNVNVSLYGQFNPAALYVNNGDSSKLYVVDNVHSQSRFGLRARVDTTSGWQVGGRFEYGVSGNASTEVNNWYTESASEDFFKLRWAEISFARESYGKFSLGKGDSASNSTAEIDLSGTAVAMQDKTLWLASGTLWYDGSSDILSEFEVKQIYNGFDGLSRTDRIRYDTPEFGGFSLAGSYSSGDAFDGSVWYSREFSETRVAAALGVANPGDVMQGTELLYTGSASLLFPMGISATFSGSLMEKKEEGFDDATVWWAKLGYKKSFYEGATTAFSLDYGASDNISVNDEKGSTWAFAAVHDVADWGTEFYAIYRMYMADSERGDFDDVNALMAGARLRF